MKYELHHYFFFNIYSYLKLKYKLLLFQLIASCLSSAVRREKLSAALEMEGYIRKLLNLFHICEDLENLEGLHHLFEVFKNIFLLNKNALFEVMFAEDTI